MSEILRERFGAITAAESRALDAAARDLGVDTPTLMEAAGAQVARLAWRLAGGRRRRLHVVAGRGNNGGDALVAARWLAGWGCAVSVAVVATEDRLGDARAAQCATARAAGADVIVSPLPARARPPQGTALVVDGLLGTGLIEAPREVEAAVISAMGDRVLSIDVPSGLDADTGSTPGTAVAALATCALASCKRGFWEPGARRWLGDLFVADIGVPHGAWARCGLTAPPGVRAGAIHHVAGTGTRR